MSDNNDGTFIPKETYDTLADFLEAFEDHLDPDGSTTPEVVVKQWFRYREAAAREAVTTLRAFMDKPENAPSDETEPQTC